MDITISKPGKFDEKGLDLQLKEKLFVDEVKKARQLIEGIELPADLRDGLSFLDMKNDTMLSYLIDLMNIVLKKAIGEKIEGHESVERICEYRLILEKSKPIHQKLKYQLNRLLTARETNERMNLEDFDLDAQDNQEDSDNHDGVPPPNREQDDEQGRYNEVEDYEDGDEQDGEVESLEDDLIDTDSDAASGEDTD